MVKDDIEPNVGDFIAQKEESTSLVYEEEELSIKPEQEAFNQEEESIVLIEELPVEKKSDEESLIVVEESLPEKAVEAAEAKEPVELFPNYDFSKELDLKEDFMIQPEIDQTNINMHKATETKEAPLVVPVSEFSIEEPDRISPDDIAQEILTNVQNTRNKEQIEDTPVLSIGQVVQAEAPQITKESKKETKNPLGALSIVSKIQAFFHSTSLLKKEEKKPDLLVENSRKTYRERMSELLLQIKKPQIVFAMGAGIFVFWGASIMILSSVNSIPVLPEPPAQETISQIPSGIPSSEIVPNSPDNLVKTPVSPELHPGAPLQYVEGVDFFVTKVVKKNISKKRLPLSPPEQK